MAPKKQSSPSAEKAAERLAVIVDAAERAALEIIDDAAKEAQRHLREVQARADRMVAERLREAAERLESEGADSEGPLLRPVESLPPEKPRLSEVEPQAPVQPPPAPPASGNGGSAAARLLATQMAVSGSSRGEIEARLRSGFEIEDTSEILDAILGPEG